MSDTSRTSENVKEELNRRNISFLNINLDLPKLNEVELSFKHKEKQYFTDAKFAESSLGYSPFIERCESSFEEIQFKPIQTFNTDLIKTTLSGFEGSWNKDNKTFTFSNSFQRPGIYTGVIKLKKDYKKDYENYIVSFKKLPSDYIDYESLEITAGKLIIKDLRVSDGYKCIRVDKFDEIKITYDKNKSENKNNTVTINTKTSGKKYINEENETAVSLQETVVLLDESIKSKKKNITVSLLELVDTGKLEKDKIITITIKYFGVYEVSAYILLVEEKAKADFSNIFVTNKGSNAALPMLSSVYGLSTVSAAFPTATANTTVSGMMKLGTYSIATFEQTYGNSTNAFGGAELHIRSMVDSIAIFINNPVFSTPNPKMVALQRTESEKIKLSSYMRNPVINSSASHFVYTYQLASYSMSTVSADTSGVAGLIGKYFYKVGSGAPQLYFDATKYLDIHCTTSTTPTSIYFTFSTGKALEDQKKKDKKINPEETVNLNYLKEGNAIDFRFRGKKSKDEIKKGIDNSESGVSAISSTVPTGLATGFFGQWGISSIKVGITNSAFNHGYNPLVVSFTAEDGSNIRSVVSTISNGNSDLKWITQSGLLTVVKTTIMLPIDKIKGYNITPRINQLSSSEFNVRIENVDGLLEGINKDKNKGDVNKFKFKFYDQDFVPKSSIINTLNTNQTNSNITFDVKLSSSVTNINTSVINWELSYSSQKIVCDKYNIPKIESVNLSKFDVKENSTKSGVDITTEFQGFEKNNDSKNEVKLEVVKTEENYKMQSLLIEDKKKLSLSALSKVKEVSIGDFDKVVSVSLEYKDKTKKIKEVQTVSAKEELPKINKYQGIYRVGVLIEKEGFILKLKHNIKDEKTIEVIVTPEFNEDFKLDRIIKGNVYYKKIGKDSENTYKILPIDLDENKNGRALITEFDYNTKYDIYASYDYSSSTDTENYKESENRIYSNHTWALMIMA